MKKLEGIMEVYMTDAEKVQKLYELHDKGYDNHYIAKALDTYETCVKAILGMRHELEREKGKQANCIHRYTEDGVSLCECDNEVCSGNCCVSPETIKNCQGKYRNKKRHIRIISDNPQYAKVFVDGEEITDVSRVSYKHTATNLATLELVVNKPFDADDYAYVRIEPDIRDTIDTLICERACEHRDCDGECGLCDIPRDPESVKAAFDKAIDILEELYYYKRARLEGWLDERR
jgi:hypothetical protein